MPTKSPRTRAIEEIIRKLERELDEVQVKVRHFNQRHKQLVDEQTVLKRKRAELHRLIQGLKHNIDPGKENPQ